MDSQTIGIIVGGVVAGIILLTLFIVQIFVKEPELPQYKKEALWTIMQPDAEPGQLRITFDDDGVARMATPVKENTSYKSRKERVKSIMRRGPLFFLNGPGTPLEPGVNYSEPILRRGHRRSSRKSVRKQ